MPISPWPAGQTQPLQATIANSDGSIPSFTGLVSLSLSIRNKRTKQQITGAGSFGVPNQTTGLVTYTWGAADPTNIPGDYELFIIGNYGTYLRYWGPQQWTVTGAIA